MFPIWYRGSEASSWRRPRSQGARPPSLTPGRAAARLRLALLGAPGGPTLCPACLPGDGFFLHSAPRSLAQARSAPFWAPSAGMAGLPRVGGLALLACGDCGAQRPSPRRLPGESVWHPASGTSPAASPEASSSARCAAPPLRAPAQAPRQLLSCSCGGLSPERCPGAVCGSAGPGRGQTMEASSGGRAPRRGLLITCAGSDARRAPRGRRALSCAPASHRPDPASARCGPLRDGRAAPALPSEYRSPAGRRRPAPQTQTRRRLGRPPRQRGLPRRPGRSQRAPRRRSGGSRRDALGRRRPLTSLGGPGGAGPEPGASPARRPAHGPPAPAARPEDRAEAGSRLKDRAGRARRSRV